MNSSDFKKNILDKLNTVLKPRHFRKKSNIFSFTNKDLTYFICVQNTVASTDNELKTTVNVEISSSTLTMLDDISLPGYLQRHYIKNIGDYEGQSADRWWTIHDQQTSERAQNEIADIITNKVLPEIAELQTTKDLAVLWKKQVSPGLTPYQSKEYLSLLELDK